MGSIVTRNNHSRGKGQYSFLRDTMLLAITVLGFTQAAAQAMSGTYTVCASGCNYSTVTAAANAVKTNGVNGPVVISIAAGTYTETPALNNGVTGASATNTITFQGAGRTQTIITNNTALRTFDAVATSHLRFKDLTIENLTPSGITYGLYNNTAQNTLLERVNVTLRTGSGTSYAIYTNTNTRFVMRDCEVTGGYYGLRLYGTSGNYTNNGWDTIVNCKFLKQYYYPIYTYYLGNSLIEGNLVDSAENSFNYSLYAYYMGQTVVRNNVFQGPNQYAGIHLYYPNQYGNAAPLIVENNIIASMSPTAYHCIYVYSTVTGSSVDLTVRHNTMRLNGSSTTTYPFYFFQSAGTSRGIKIQSNIFDRTGSGYAAYYSNAGANEVIEGNNNYNTGGALIWYNGSIYNTLSDFQAGNSFGHGRYDQNLQPQYESSTDLHLDQNKVNASGVYAGLDYDIDGDARCKLFPTAGADESFYGKTSPTAQFFGPSTVIQNSPAVFRNFAKHGEPKIHRWYIDGQFASDSVHLVAALSGSAATISLATVSCAGSDSVYQTFQVVPPSKAPVADFVANTNVISSGGTVRFFDLSYDGPATWKWEIIPKEVLVGSTMEPAYTYVAGSENAQNIEVRFLHGGDYDVCLTVSNAIGSSQKLCFDDYIEVTPSINMGSQTYASTNSGFLYDDGGPSGNYGPSRQDKFLIEACTDTLYLFFHEFDTEHSYDYLRIFIGRDNTGTPLHCTNNIGIGNRGPGFNSYVGQGGANTCLPFRGFHVPSDTLVIPGGVAYFEFESDPSVHRAGFAMEWWSTRQHYDKPAAVIDMPDSVCVNTAVRLRSVSQGPNLKLLWDLDGDFDFFESTSSDFLYPFFMAGDIDVTLIVQNCGGYDTMVKRIHVYEPAKPVPSFTTDNTNPAQAEIVTFTSTTPQCLDSVRWVFTNQLNPNATVTYVPGFNRQSEITKVVFNDTGCWNVTLHAINTNGSVNTSRSCYVLVRGAYCVPSVTNLIPDIGISRFAMGDIDHSSPQAQQDYSNYLSTTGTNLEKQVTYTVQLNRNANPRNAIDVAIWIDYDHDGDFDDVTELIASATNSMASSFTWNYTIPANVPDGATVLRVAVNRGNLGNEACGQNMFGEYEDYRVIIMPDRTPPVLTLLGPDTLLLERGRPFGMADDPWVTAEDNLDGDISANVVRTGWQPGNQQLIGTYVLMYNVQDAAGNAAPPVRRVVVVIADTTPPVIELAGDNPEYVAVNDPFWSDPGVYSAIDLADGDLTPLVQTTGMADASNVGEYVIGYEVYDVSGNRAYVERTVIVYDSIRPEINLIGSDMVTLNIGDDYVRPNIIITDNYWQGLEPVEFGGPVDTEDAGTFIIVYKAVDGSGNWAFDSIIVTVTVVDNEAPVIVLEGPETDMIDVFGTYTDPGATAVDNSRSFDGEVVRSGTFYDAFPNGRATEIGDYTIVYSATDPSGNTATATRTVKVVDRVAPTIQLLGDPVVTINSWRDYEEAGVEVVDNYDPDPTVEEAGTFLGVNHESIGAYYITYTAVDGSGNRSQPVTRTIFIRTSMEDGAAISDIKLFPNPTTGVLNITAGHDGERATITILDMQGRIVRVVEGAAIGKQVYQVDLSDLRAGTYIVRKQTPEGVSNGKVTIMR